MCSTPDFLNAQNSTWRLATSYQLAISLRMVGAPVWCAAKQRRESNRVQGTALCGNGRMAQMDQLSCLLKGAHTVWAVKRPTALPVCATTYASHFTVLDRRDQQLFSLPGPHSLVSLQPHNHTSQSVQQPMQAEPRLLPWNHWLPTPPFRLHLRSTTQPHRHCTLLQLQRANRYACSWAHTVWSLCSLATTPASVCHILCKATEASAIESHATHTSLTCTPFHHTTYIGTALCCSCKGPTAMLASRCTHSVVSLQPTNLPATACKVKATACTA
jgi:hypothetical protein